LQEKLLVMATATEICFEGSATLCAVNVALAAMAELRRGVLAAGIHRSAPAAASRAREAQRTAVSGWRYWWPWLEWLRRAEFHTCGVRRQINEISLVIAKLPLPDFVESAVARGRD